MKCFEPHPGIKVYDNVLSFSEKANIEQQCQRMPYLIGWKDTYKSEDTGFFYHECDAQNWYDVLDNKIASEFPYILNNSEPFSQMEDRDVLRSVINCNTIADSMTTHDHPNQDVILYYVNTEWKTEWGGETIFYDKNEKEIIFASPYVPNRMILFAGEIPHRYNSPASVAPKYRFSISTFFPR